MAVIPSGPESEALDACRTLIANCAIFQTITGTANATAAKARVYIGCPVDETTDPPTPLWTRPCCFIYWAGDATRNNRFPNGTIEVIFEQDVHADYQSATAADYTDAAHEFENSASTLKKQMMATSQGPGFLFVRSIEFTTIAQRADVKQGEQTDFFRKIMRVNYGLEA